MAAESLVNQARNSIQLKDWILLILIVLIVYLTLTLEFS